MSLVYFIENNYSLSEQSKDILREIEAETSNNFRFKNTYTIRKNARAYIQEIKTQKEISERSRRVMLGYEETIKNLAPLDSEDLVSMRFIENDAWDGSVFFSIEKKYYGIILGKKINSQWKTPPNWDGSLEMLEKFNNNLSRDS